MSSATPTPTPPTPPTVPAVPKKPSVFSVFKKAFVAWAESPTGKHALIAIAAGLGAAVEQAVKALVH
jgi:hypothetical protein